MSTQHTYINDNGQINTYTTFTKSKAKIFDVVDQGRVRMLTAVLALASRVDNDASWKRAKTIAKKYTQLENDCALILSIKIGFDETYHDMNINEAVSIAINNNVHRLNKLIQK